jgi:hypothetical protein
VYKYTGAQGTEHSPAREPVTLWERTSGPDSPDRAIRRMRRSDPFAHPGRMSATPNSQQRYPLGVALCGALFAFGLPMVGGSVYLMITAVEKDAPRALVVAAAAMVAGIGGFILYAGAGLYYQAWPVPLSRVRDSLVWRPPLVFRIAVVICVVALSTTFVALVTIPAIRRVPLPLVVSAGVAVLIAWLIGLRLPVARLEADDWGIRCTNPFTTVRLPWSEVRTLEARGRSMLSQRIVAVTQGRDQMLWVWDPRIPVSRDAARLLVAELEAVRQSAGA